MSDEGSYNRGEKWLHFGKNKDGNLKPEVANDENKMVDVNFYLEKVKEKETKSKGKK